MNSAPPTISAIPTTYKGIKFRSRLEARWAVFFETVKTPWSYEPEGFHLPSGPYGEPNPWTGEVTTLDRDWNYLPDFWLPEVDAWFEVKGEDPALNYWTMLDAFQISTKKKVVIAIGNIPDVPDYYSESGYWGEHEVLHVLGDCQYEFCRCTTCNRLGCQFNGRAGRICEHSRDDKDYNVTDDITRAYQTARTYRFWDPAR
jgi:hypothetical protein